MKVTDLLRLLTKYERPINSIGLHRCPIGLLRGRLASLGQALMNPWNVRLIKGHPRRLGCVLLEHLTGACTLLDDGDVCFLPPRANSKPALCRRRHLHCQR